MIADGQQRRVEAGDPPGPLLCPRNPRPELPPQPTTRLSPHDHRLADLRMLKPNPLKCLISAFTASLQAAHDAAEAQRVEAAKLREELAAANSKIMEETVKLLEAEKDTIEVANAPLKVNFKIFGILRIAQLA